VVLLNDRTAYVLVETRGTFTNNIILWSCCVTDYNLWSWQFTAYQYELTAEMYHQIVVPLRISGYSTTRVWVSCGVLRALDSRGARNDVYAFTEREKGEYQPVIGPLSSRIRCLASERAAQQGIRCFLTRCAI